MPEPNFFIVGSPKAGTSGLSQYLGEHPQVFFCHPKEPFYWCQDFPPSKSIHGLDSLESYLQLFEDADPERHPAIGEGSTTYLQSKVALKGIRGFNPDAKVIAMLRNPVEVVTAMHGELLRHGFEEEASIEAAWAKQDARAEGKDLPANCKFEHQLQYRDVASYAVQIERLTQVFPENQRKIIIFDDFKADTQSVYRSTVKFLGLQDDHRNEFPKVHSSKVVRSRLIAKLRSDPPPFLKGSISSLQDWYYRSTGPTKKLLQSMLTRRQQRDPLTDRFRQELQDSFRPEVEKLSELLGRDLRHWVR